LVEDQESARLQRQGHRRRLPRLHGQPDGTGAAQLGAGSASFPLRSTGTPVWSPSGSFIAFVAEKSSHPGSSVTATPGWGGYSDLWVANADGSHAGDAFNETGGFSADSSSLVFTSDFETHNFWTSQIYRYDLNSGASTRLTRGNSYNEHPRYTPDGQGALDDQRRQPITRHRLVDDEPRRLKPTAAQ
jgi:Tol biopolymer transport system component